MYMPGHYAVPATADIAYFTAKQLAGYAHSQGICRLTFVLCVIPNWIASFYTLADTPHFCAQF